MEKMYRDFTICEKCGERCYLGNRFCEDCANELLQKSLSLSRKYMSNVMCADDVPFEEWFIKCAINNWEPF